MDHDEGTAPSPGHPPPVYQLSRRERSRNGRIVSEHEIYRAARGGLFVVETTIEVDWDDGGRREIIGILFCEQPENGPPRILRRVPIHELRALLPHLSAALERASVRGRPVR